MNSVAIHPSLTGYEPGAQPRPIQRSYPFYEFHTMSAIAPSDDYVFTKTAKTPRLTHNNYPIWAKAMRFALIGMEAWGIVNGTAEEPDVPGDNATLRERNEYKDYTKRHSKAVSLIYGAITPAIQAYITAEANDPALMWLTL